MRTLVIHFLCSALSGSVAPLLLLPVVGLPIPRIAYVLPGILLLAVLAALASRPA